MALTRLVFDIETAPIDGAEEYIEPVSAPSNYKDPEKIAAYVAEKQGEVVSRCSLDPDLCRVVAIGYWAEDGAPCALTIRDYIGAEGNEHDAEVELLEDFWIVANGKQLVGFNCLAFDLPVLMRRSLYLGVSYPAIQIDKYRHSQVDDLQMFLSFNGAFKMHGLSFYAKRFGFEVEDGITGAEIGQAVIDGRWDDIKRHVEADVQKTALVAAKCGYFNRVTAGAF